MRYWSKGLGRRSALQIDWSSEQCEITIDSGKERLAELMPPRLMKGQPPPPGDMVIVKGVTSPPIEWEYISVFSSDDVENLIGLATRPQAVHFFIESPGGGRLFLRMAGIFAWLIIRYPFIWFGVRVQAGWQWLRARVRAAASKEPGTAGADDGGIAGGQTPEDEPQGATRQTAAQGDGVPHTKPGRSEKPEQAA